MANKFTQKVDTRLISGKIDQVSRVLNSALASSDFSSKESYLREAAILVSAFYETLNTSLFNPTDTIKETLPNLESYNNTFETINKDLFVLFGEFENIENLVLTQFNFFVSENLRLNRLAKSVSSSLGDYILYSKNPTKDLLYARDSFSTAGKLLLDTPLLSEKQAELNDSEGLITLPFVEGADSRIKIGTVPAINTGASNGVSGNNQELNAQFNGDLNVILDNNPDTWFEYERVFNVDTGQDLVLDMVIVLDEVAIINFLRINPNHFGTKTTLKIDTIETSIDGSIYRSIKDDLAIAQTETELDDVFSLSPTSSTFAGQGVFTFFPRKAKYIHLVFRQESPYPIVTSAGIRQRYAIGIRDINVRAIQFERIGELISTPVFAPLGDEIRKVLLETDQIPSESSELVSIVHQISPDNGITWVEIKPDNFTELTPSEIPRILNFNSADVDSINVDHPVNSVMYKAILKRNSEAFSENVAVLSNKKEHVTELHSVANRNPFVVKLEGSPIEGTLRVVDPSYGSRGLENIRLNLGNGLGDSLELTLPWQDLRPSIIKSLDPVTKTGIATEEDPQVVLVNGVEWERVDTLEGRDFEERVYVLDYVNGKLKTGDGRGALLLGGQAPSAGSDIDIYFKPERILLSADTNNHIAKLDFPTVASKDDIEIRAFGATQVVQKTLNKRARVHRLGYKYVTDGSFVDTSESDLFLVELDFKDGKSELDDDGEYSIDYVNGIAYTYNESDDVETTTVSFQYSPQIDLLEKDWEFFDDSNDVARSIVIKETGYHFISVTTEPLALSRLCRLSNSALVRGSLKFNLPSTVTKGSIISPIDPFREEVDFVDGHSEFLNLLPTAETLEEPVVAGSLKTFSLLLVPSDNFSFLPSFSNTELFESKVPGVPTEEGKYQIDHLNRQIILFTDSTSEDYGTVSYYYTDNTDPSEGLYSVDYKNGDIYTFTNLADVDTGGENFSVDYNFTHFEIRYPIARVLEEKKYSVDLVAGTVALKDSEVLRNLRVQTGDARYASGKFYQISYDRFVNVEDNLGELETFYSPILKSYELRILTRNNIF